MSDLVAAKMTPDAIHSLLSLPSSNKEQAQSMGMIRPYLLLVSMHPLARISVARVIDINLLTSKSVADAHASSLKLFTSRRKVRARWVAHA